MCLNGKVFPIQLPSIPHMVYWLLLVDSGLCCKCGWCTTLLACDSHMDTFVLLEIWIQAFLHLKLGCNICPLFVYYKTCITASTPTHWTTYFGWRLVKICLTGSVKIDVAQYASYKLVLLTRHIYWLVQVVCYE